MHGSRPRTKTPDQMLRELDALRRAGRRGHVHIVDDNFIGKRKQTARLLRRLAAWGRENHYPFYFGANATISLAEETELLGLCARRTSASCSAASRRPTVMSF